MRSLAFFNGDPCVVMWLVDNRHRHHAGLTGSHDTANEEWGLQLAKTGDSDLATSGDFFMATDRQASVFAGHVPDEAVAPGVPWRLPPAIDEPEWVVTGA